MPADLDALFARARRVSIEGELARRGVHNLRRVGKELVGPCPRCGGTDRFSVNLSKGVWHCRNCKTADIAGDVIGLRMWWDGSTATEAAEKLAGEHLSKGNGTHRPNGGKRAPLGKIVAVYPYEDEHAEQKYEVVRFDPKDFRQRRPNGHGGHVWNVHGVEPLPYRLPELVEAIALERAVFVVEGEKDVESLRRHNVPATCNHGGAGKWAGALDHWFTGADVVVVADNDEPGRAHAAAVAERLTKGGADRVRLLDIARIWPECPPKGDVSDWLDAGGGTVERLWSAVESLGDWRPTTEAGPAPIPIVSPFPIVGETIPRRPWLIPGLLLRRQVTLLVAPPGSGKSLLTLQIAMLCSSGRSEWGGWHPRGRYRVLVINSEEDADEQRRRLYAAAQKMEVAMDSMSGLMFAAEPESIVIATADAKTKTVVRTPMLDRIVKTVLDNQIDIVVVDPFAETFVGDENSNSEVKWAGVAWRDVARITGAALLLVHHARKYSSGMAGDMDAARGGGSLAGIARQVCTLFTMTPDEAKKLGVEEDEKRARLLRFDDAKANQSLVSFKARWFEKYTYTLPNGSTLEPADDVGILIEWQPERAKDRLLQNTAQANLILDDIQIGIKGDDGTPTGEPYAPTPARGPKPKRWGGVIIQQHLQCSETEADEILAAWIKHEVVEVFYGPIKNYKKGAAACLRVNNGNRPGTVIEEVVL